jgi:pantoate--beta-alanine ligase
VTALVRAIEDIRAHVAALRKEGPIALVPTMGALHAGHAALIERAAAGGARVVVSIFVNPLQFDREDDLRRYPRTLDADRDLCERMGVAAIFAPDAAELYPVPPLCTVDVGILDGHLCGPHRPGHFRGVATVVLKLLSIVGPDRACFGEKDGQQLAIVRRMVADFNVPVTIVGVPTVRESDGLAMSSRNQHLTAAERQLAPLLYRALQSVAQRFDSGESDVAAALRHAAGAIPADPRLRLEYLDVVDRTTVQPVSALDGPVMIAGALWVGGTRLIDNLLYTPSSV